MKELAKYHETRCCKVSSDRAQSGELGKQNEVEDVA